MAQMVRDYEVYSIECIRHWNETVKNTYEL